ncbi:MAG TPA: penicillin-binding transpeptidase domain-containing protein [Bacillota bacterium]|nr:penicillin-binding transpeptidase domain-containing protein [Bacillota bacterium]HOL08533.1 penicillin-binding transpeptidase domain-containing protein [Bacillota bacterium]HPO96986.1 penicillin-binding transpeptidase domain-containing protein [Bacillota bacterium]
MSQTMTLTKKRVVLLLFAVLLLMGLLVLRVIYIQVFMSGWLKKEAENQRFRAVTILPRRGTIYDRSGFELAISIDSQSVYVIPREVGIEETFINQKGRKSKRINKDNASKRKIAEVVGGVLSIEPDRLERLISKQASFVWLKRKSTLEEINLLRKTLKEHHIQGIEISQSPKRFYPQKTLAAQLIGIAGIDNQGLEGLEKQLDSYLRGIPGSDRAEFDTRGHHIPQGERRYYAPIDGDSVYLTIDQNIQYIVERELEKAVNDTLSKRGMAISVNPQTGEILALACYPSFDPNRYNEYPTLNRRNPLFSDMYEPGSTFKVFTSAAALEEGLVSPESTFFDSGYLVVDDRRLKCWKAGGHGSQNFVEALENSCNPVFATLALRITKEKFYDYIKGFGFGALTGVEFPGESAGMLKKLSDVKNVELATIGFGQGITVTPIQMAMGVAAIANGGYLLKPQLIKEIRTPDGKIKQRYERQVVRQIISNKTAALMRSMMESVVTNGSGNKAYIPGYRVAGKTGTAQKVIAGRKGYSSLRIASFVGFAPADNPQLLTLVILDEPGSAIKYGGVIAAPVVGNIFKDALRYLGVSPQLEREILERELAESVTVPQLTNLSLDEATKTLKQIGLDCRLIGDGKVVYDQVPKSGAKLRRGTKVILYMDAESKFNFENTKTVVPDLHGFPLQKCEQILGELGLRLEASGTGHLVEQMPAPGELVDNGSVIKAKFKVKEITD